MEPTFAALHVGRLRVHARGGVLGRDAVARRRAEELLARLAADARVPDREVLVVRALTWDVTDGADRAAACVAQARSRAVRAFHDGAAAADAVWFADEVELTACLIRDTAHGGLDRWYWQRLLPARGAPLIGRAAMACLDRTRWLPGAFAAVDRPTAEQASAAFGPRWCAALLDGVLAAYPARVDVRGAAASTLADGVPVGLAGGAAPHGDDSGTGGSLRDVALALHLRPSAVSQPERTRRAVAERAARREGPVEPPPHRSAAPARVDVAAPDHPGPAGAHPAEPVRPVVPAAVLAQGPQGRGEAGAVPAQPVLAQSVAEAADSMPDGTAARLVGPRGSDVGRAVSTGAPADRPLRAGPIFGGPDERFAVTAVASGLYLVNLLDVLVAAVAPSDGGPPERDVSAWFLLELALRRVTSPWADPDDPLWELLASADPEGERQEPDGLADRLADVVAAELDRRMVPAASLAVPGRVVLGRTHLDVLLPIERIDLAARVCGLDRDPGWVPALARVVLLHFVERW